MDQDEALTCIWTQEANGADCWSTQCGHLFEFNDGGPSDNEMRFCGYCGARLVEVLYGEEEE